MFKALYSHVNNIIEKYLQIYNHILLYLQWVKKEKIKTNGIYTNLYKQWSVITEFNKQVRLKWSFKTRDGVGLPNFIGY